MLPVLTSLQNPRVKRIVRLRNRRERDREGVFVVEGEREVGRALAAGLEVEEAYVLPDRLTGDLPFADRPQEVSPEVMAKMSYRDPPTGVLGVFRTPRRTLDDLAVPPRAIFLVAVNTQKPGNLGAMARTAAAAGCAGVIAAEADVDVFNPNAIRNSTGAIFSTPVVAADADAVRRWLAASKIHSVATVTAGGEDLWTGEWDTPGAVAILIGPEHEGLDAGWTDFANGHLSIPTSGEGVDSLNASNAAAVVLFEVIRRRA